MKKHVNAMLFSLAIVLASLLLGNAYKSRTTSAGTISVTGLGEKEFVSDLIVWEGSFTRESKVVKQAYNQLEKDKRIIEAYLKNNGINPGEIVFKAIETKRKTKKSYSRDGDFAGEELSGYVLSESLQITSKEVEKVENISRKITELLNKGIQFYSGIPRYYYTRLSDLKIELISKATEDAKIRAEKISLMSGSALGNLESAQMGIFQITGQNSDEEYSWGGTFNTSSKEKKASITVKLSYKTK